MRNEDYSIENLGNGIHWIRELFYKDEHANLFLLEGNPGTIIDSGVGLRAELYDEIKDNFGDVTVVNTHAHFDHCSGNSFFAKAYIHFLEWEKLQTHDRRKLGLHYFVEENLHGYGGEKEIQWMLHKASRTEYQFFREGDVLKTGVGEWNILHTPGHSSGGLSLYCPEIKTLISGDSLYKNEDGLYDDFCDFNKDELLKTLDRFSKLEIHKVLPGHNKPFSGSEAPEIISQWIQELKG
jgi:glyoxylase-like metal-dependent hydrolase (beta-lactamase superfamily II)